jgi:UDP-N-acetylglucosamine acyltransferase
MTISEKAIVDKSAKIHKSAKICDYVVIGPNVEIGAGSVIESHAIIKGPTKIGKNNHIYSFASIGGDPQDITYESSQESNLIIGNNNLIREFCTINRGTEKENSITRIGSDNLLMAYVHIAHDCKIGNNIIMTNNSSLAGHVKIEDCAILGGFTLVKQFCMIGKYAYIGMGCQINKDVPPYMIASYVQARIRGINVKGMRRSGFSSNAIASIKRAFKVVYRQSQGQLLDIALTKLEKSESDSPEVMQYIQFIRESKIGIMRGPIDE